MKSVVESAVSDIDVLKTYVDYNSNINNKNLQSNSINKKEENIIIKDFSLYKRHYSFSVFINNLCKRTIDIIGAIIGLIILCPLTLLIAIFNFFYNEYGPIFYTQERIGKNGKTFTMYKYRSMVINADKKLNKYLKENEDAREEYRQYKKLKKDPRITKVGKFLRKNSLDEFPQFINVLKGEMSLVGPRPYLKKEKKDVGENYKTIISVKPGITGYWQVNGRSDKDFKERTSMDVDYIRNKSFWFDFKILIKTILIVLKKEGAV